MRRWRLAFSGVLQEEDCNADIKRNVFVKFSFTWTASSGVFDLKTDIPSHVMAKFLSTQPWNAYSPDTNKYLDHLDSYVQAGSLTGTIQVDGGDEMVKHFFGTRKRYYDLFPYVTVNVEYFGYMEDGEMMYFGDFGLLQETSSSLQCGYIVMANSLSGPVESLKIQTSTERMQTQIDFSRETFVWCACFEKATLQKPVKDFQQMQQLQFCPVTLNNRKGRGMIISTVRKSNPHTPSTEKVLLPLLQDLTSEYQPLVLSLENQFCRHSEYTGGKGSSLADLHALCQADKTFSVPKGVVVTTIAYELFIQRCNFACTLERLQIAAGKLHPDDFKRECESVSTELSKHELPWEIKEALQKELAVALGKNFTHCKVAVRSSAAGEDSEEMSAAGQMKTFLGVSGAKMIFDAVVKCWASQFNFIACQYKKQNGQLLNSPMAVVVQEMVDAQVAGVMFTCDPVSGNPTYITITSNYGIGESVVSATAEPDTITLKRTLKGGVEMESQIVGKKSQMTVLNDDGVCDTNVSEDKSVQLSLYEEDSLKLGKIGLMVEAAYGCLVDIEWAFRDNQLYLLQARPVTTFDRETKFDIMHECDGFFRMEKEFFSVANVGEVFPGATSNLGLTTVNMFCFELLVLRIYGRRNPAMFPFSPYYQRMGTFANHSMFNILDDLMRFYFGEHTLFTRSHHIAALGRVIEDETICKAAVYRNQFHKSVMSPIQFYYLLQDMWTAGSNLKFFSELNFGLQIDLSQQTSLLDMYISIYGEWVKLSESFCCHFQCSFFSSMMNTWLFSVLVSANKGEWTQDVYNDVAYTLSNCNDVESVQVPLQIERLARSIVKDYGPGFDTLESREALMWLERTDLSSGNQFREFLKRHGHRCVKEFDLYSKPWGNDPIPVIRIVQDMAGKLGNKTHSKAEISTEETINNLKSPLNRINRFILKYIIPKCRKGVAYREASKSLMISLINSLRGAYRQVAERMVFEGYLPSADLFYFLEYHEVIYLLKTRSPKLVQKVIRRRNLFPEMDKMALPEITEGFPVPINFEVKEVVREGSMCVKGVPVSQGVAVGRARVATSLSEAADIQKGEILIAYSTDIGWSPYFPMLAGVATELGGLISHGAVVAREYGLPCVVAAQNITRSFKTGDLVQIDGNKGIVTLVDE